MLVTGVSGYIGCDVFKKFADDGTYKVIGTLCDPSNEAKLAEVKATLGEKYSEVELRAMDLLDEASVDKAVEGVNIVIHVASPYYMSVEHEDELLKPAVDGSLFVMRAAQKHKVERVVVTSSGFASFVPAPEN